MSILEYKGYQGTAEYSPEDRVLFGKVLHVRGLIMYQSDTAIGIESAFREAVDAYLTDCEEAGTAPQKPFSGSFNVRLGETLHRDAALAASRCGKSLNDFMCSAVRQMLAQPQPVHVQHNHTHTHVVKVEEMLLDRDQWSSAQNGSGWLEGESRAIN